MKKEVLFLLSCLCCLSQAGTAAVLEHSFTITGDNGETGGGSFTWDDTTVPDGSVLTEAEILSFNLAISGGNVAGGSDSFTKTNCRIINASDTPDFGFALTFDICDSGTNRIGATGPYTHSLTPAGAELPVSTLTVVPGSTTAAGPTPPPPAKPIPTLSEWVLLLLAAFTGLLGVYWLRRSTA